MAHKITTALALLSVAFAAPALAQRTPAAQPQHAETETLAPERIASGNMIVSASDPAVRITLPEEAVYVGAVRWPLYGVADAELHAFVEADEHRIVRRFYWVQFEQYLPVRPDARYDYPRSNPETVTLSGRTVHVSPGFGPGSDHEARAGSDSAAFRALLADNGYHLPRATASVRFVDLFEPTHRKELMIIYGEDMRPTMETVAELVDSETGAIRLADLYAPLIERGQSRIMLEPLEED